MNFSIKHWPSQERPRERLLQQGAQSLSDAELLAIFLRSGSQQHSSGTRHGLFRRGHCGGHRSRGRLRAGRRRLRRS